MTTPNTPANGGQILTDLLQELLDEYLATMSSAYCQVDTDEELVAKVRAALAAPAIPTVDRNAVLEEAAMWHDKMAINTGGSRAAWVHNDSAKCIRALKSANPVAQPAAQVVVKYTCVGKGGEYDLVGTAKGAGQCRDNLALTVYRDAVTGALYYRTEDDFAERMSATPATVKTAEKN